MTFADNLRLSKNFMSNEFRCKCGCGEFKIDSDLVLGLQEIRDLIRKPIFINSGFRCLKHNTAIGGSPTSQHMLGKAADIRCPGLTPLELAEYAKGVEVFATGGIGLYRVAGFVHVDVRGVQARWKM